MIGLSQAPKVPEKKKVRTSFYTVYACFIYSHIQFVSTRLINISASRLSLLVRFFSQLFMTQFTGLNTPQPYHDHTFKFRNSSQKNSKKPPEKNLQKRFLFKVRPARVYQVHALMCYYQFYYVMLIRLDRQLIPDRCTSLSHLILLTIVPTFYELMSCPDSLNRCFCC